MANGIPLVKLQWALREADREKRERVTVRDGEMINTSGGYDYHLHEVPGEQSYWVRDHGGVTRELRACRLA